MKQQEFLLKFARAFRSGDISSVPDLLQKAQKKFPKAPWLPYAKGTYLFRTGKIRESIPWLEKGVELHPKDVNALYALAQALTQLAEYDRAISLLKRVLKITPDDLGTLEDYRTLLHAKGDHVGCKEICERILQLSPDLPGTLVYMAESLLSIGGDIQKSFDYFNRAMELKPNRTFASNMLLYSNYVDFSPEHISELHKKQAHLFENSEPEKTAVNAPRSKIRVGFVSADFRKHSVAFFLEALFENYSRENFEFYLFANTAPYEEDEVSKKFKSITDFWFNIKKLSDNEAAELIKREEVEILIDLSGHTGGNRLGIFGLKPAPIQITWLGYPNTTGLKAMDFRITDNIADSENADSLYTEKLLRFSNCFLCYTPPENLPEACPPDSGTITFGSFNNTNKISQKTIEVWSSILKAFPNSKLLLKHNQWHNPKMREIFSQKFAEYGVETQRIEFKNKTESNFEHFAEYNKVDIALDTFPYNGTTTTCDAMAMGVPVISLLGKNHASRVSASININAGFECFVAKNEQEFVQIAVYYAQNREKLLEIKNKMQSQMLASVLCSGKEFAKEFMGKIDEIHRNYHRKE